MGNLNPNGSMAPDMTGPTASDGTVLPMGGNLSGYDAYLAAQQATTTLGNQLVNPYSGNANDIAASLINAQYANWQKNFQPIEMNVLQQSSLNNPNILPDAVNQAKTTAGATANTMGGVEQRQISRLGIQPTDQQAGVSARLRNLTRASTVAGAENAARSNVATTDEMIAMGGIPSTAK